MRFAAHIPFAHVPLLLAGAAALGAVSGCDRKRPADTGTASIYAADSVGRGAPAGTLASPELETPRIISAMQAQLRLLHSSPQLTAENRTAHKNLLAAMVEAMRADRTRRGIAGGGGFQALGDSVMEDVGGGSGVASGPDSAKLSVHLDRVNRLILMYAQTVKPDSAGGAAGKR